MQTLLGARAGNVARETDAGSGLSHFTRYIENHTLPLSNAEVRQDNSGDMLATLVSHLSNDGVWFDAVDDLIVSVVMQSDNCDVTRDIGHGRHRFAGRSGCVVITPPGTRSYWEFEGNPLVMHLSMSQARMDDLSGFGEGQLASLLNESARGPHYDQLASQLCSHVWASMAAPGGGRTTPLSLHAIGTLLAVVLSAPEKMEDGEERRNPVRPLAQWRLQRALKYMQDHLDERLTLEDLAGTVRLSPDHFLRSFTAVMGHTPHQWLTSLRIEKAKDMMLDSGAPMTEIALSLGFSSSAHFSSRFKQLTGIAPSQWRARFENGRPKGAN